MSERYRPRIVEVNGTEAEENALGVAYTDRGVIKIANFRNRLEMLNSNAKERYGKVAQALKRYILLHELGELAGRPESEEGHALMDAGIIADLLNSKNNEDVYAGIAGCVLHDIRKRENGKGGEFSRLAFGYLPEMEAYARFAKYSGLYEEVEKIVGAKEFDPWETKTPTNLNLYPVNLERRGYDIH